MKLFLRRDLKLLQHFTSLGIQSGDGSPVLGILPFQRTALPDQSLAVLHQILLLSQGRVQPSQLLRRVITVTTDVGFVDQRDDPPSDSFQFVLPLEKLILTPIQPVFDLPGLLASLGQSLDLLGRQVVGQPQGRQCRLPAPPCVLVFHRHDSQITLGAFRAMIRRVLLIFQRHEFFQACKFLLGVP